MASEGIGVATNAVIERPVKLGGGFASELCAETKYRL
jgi:hypothetical protein